MPDQGTVTDTSGIAEGDGHFLHDHPDIIGNPVAKNALAKYDSVSAALAGGVEAMTVVGRPHINIPGDEADQAAKDKFKAQISEHTGAVKTVEDFNIDGLRPDGLRPEGEDETGYNFAGEKAYLEMAVNLGMNQEQVEANIKFAEALRTARDTQDVAADKAAQDAAVVQLTSDCGGADGYKVASELNTRCLEAFFDAETAQLIEAKGMGNHVGFFKGINELAKMAVKEGRTMPASHRQGQQKTGALRYKGMEERKKANG